MTTKVFRKTTATPLHGYPQAAVAMPLLDILDDTDLERLNELLPWKAFIADAHGRRFGKPASPDKRAEPQALPDPRIARMHARFGLSGADVLEIGCFEGIHTAGLGLFGARVKAVDSRIENVAKTIVRCGMLGQSPSVFLHDVEAIASDTDRLQADLVHHVGVLYHLKDPVTHLLGLPRYVRHGIMLDTHYATDGQASDSYSVDGRSYPYRSYREYGRDEVFSGMYDHSKWLRLDTILELLSRAGLTDIEVVEVREERNGPRALIFASR